MKRRTVFICLFAFLTACFMMISVFGAVDSTERAAWSVYRDELLAQESSKEEGSSQKSVEDQGVSQSTETENGTVSMVEVPDQQMPTTVAPPTTTAPVGRQLSWNIETLDEPITVSGFTYEGRANIALAEINAERSVAGAPPLLPDSALEAAALERVGEIMVKFHQDRPNGKDWYTVDTANIGICGENRLTGYSAAADAVAAWMASPGHRELMLNPNLTRTGLACVEDGGNSYWIQLFAG